MLLKNREKNDCLEEARLISLSFDDLDDIVKLQDKVLSKIVNKEIFAKTTIDEFKEYLEKQSSLLGIRLNENNKLIAVGVYVNKGLDKDNYAFDLEYVDYDILKSGQIETVLVEESFRGNRLQNLLCTELINKSKKFGDKYILATVSPYNEFSLNNFKKLNFEVKKEKLKYGGFLRYILELKLNC